jgi:hypothetical protein
MPEDLNGNAIPPDPEECMSPEEEEEFLRRVQALETENQEMQVIAQRLIDTSLREMAGDALDLMLRSEEDTIQFFTHPDPNLRQAAFSLANHHWGCTETIANHCEKLAVEDPESRVRTAAIGALGSCYRGTKSPRICQLLASMIHDQSQPERLRLRAYLALVGVHGTSERLDLLAVVDSIQNIDWLFVDQYRPIQK